MALNKTDKDALVWAIEKYWKEHSDEWIAKGLSLTTEEVKAKRESMGVAYRKGTESLKEFARRYLLEMAEEDKLVFIKGLSSDLVWRMAEGSPASSGTLDISTEPIKIDITHQLAKVYGKRTIEGDAGGRPDILPEYREVSG